MWQNPLIMQRWKCTSKLNAKVEVYLKAWILKSFGYDRGSAAGPALKLRLLKSEV